MIFTYFQLINICYPYEFVDTCILMIEILKVVEKCKIYYDKGSQRSLGAGHLTKKVAQVDSICQILKIYARVAREGGGNVWNRFDTIFIPNIKL